MPKTIKLDIKLVDNLSKPADKAKGKVKQLANATTKSFRKANFALKSTGGALKMIGAGFDNVTRKIFNFRNAMIAMATIGLATFFVNTAAKVEVFATQLEVVEGSAGKAANALHAIREFARTSPLETEDVVRSFVRLRAVGIDPTLEQMRTIGGVAVLMGREMADVLDGFIGLNKRTLRAMGIEIDRTGSKAIIQSGKVRKVVEKDSASIRKAVLETWDERFPDAINRAANTTTSKVAIMKSNIWELAAVVGEGLKPAFDKVVVSIGALAGELKQFASGESKEAQQFLSNMFDESAERAARKIEWLKGKLSNIENTPYHPIFFRNPAKAAKKLREEIEKTTATMEKMSLKRLSAAVRRQGKAKFSDLGSGVLGPESTEESAGEKRKREAARKRREKEATRKRKEHIAFARSMMTLKSEMADEENARIEAKNKQTAISERLRAEASIALKENDFDKLRALEDLRWEESKAQFDGNSAAMENAKAAHTDRLIAIGKRELEFERQKNLAIFNASFRLGGALSSLAAAHIRDSKKNAEKKKKLLIGLALADAAGAAVSGVKTVWASSSTWYEGIAGTIAVLAQIAATTIPQISALKNASFATGTMGAGGMALVGERGPEMVNLPTGSQVLTNSQTNQTFGGPKLNLTVNVQGNASDSTVAKIGNTLSDFANNFEDAVRRGHLDLARIGLATA